MTRRSKVWLVVAVLFAVVNFAGGVMAAAQGELLHAGVHAALMFVGAYYVRRIWRRERPAIPAITGELTDRLTHLEQSIDAVAVEVERIGEGQRFMTRFFTENGIPDAPGEGAAEPIDIKARDAARDVRRY
jgi:hypothetical protein